MIRDKGVVTLLREPDGKNNGNMPDGEPQEYYRAWYAERTVGMSRYYAAQQANTRIDKLIRIELPRDEIIKADDTALLDDGYKYRIAQAAYLFDEDAGEDVADLSLERIGYRDGNNI